MKIGRKRNYLYEVFEFTESGKVDRHLCMVELSREDSSFDIAAAVFAKYPKVNRIVMVDLMELGLHLQDRLPSRRQGVVTGRVARRGMRKFGEEEVPLANIEALCGTPIGAR